jgi:hypothetical protein
MNGLEIGWVTIFESNVFLLMESVEGDIGLLTADIFRNCRFEPINRDVWLEAPDRSHGWGILVGEDGCLDALEWRCASGERADNKERQVSEQAPHQPIDIVAGIQAK